MRAPVVASLGVRILGRTAAEDIKDRGERQRAGQARHPDRGAARRGGQQRRRAGSAHPFGAHLRNGQRRVRKVLRARSGSRHPGQHGRGGRRDRGAVDRRAGHPAHHAHVPHRRRGADQRAVVHRVRTSKARSGSSNKNIVRNSSGDLDRDGPQYRGRDRRPGRHRACRAPYPVRLAHEGRRGRSHQARSARRRVGSLYAADHDRSRGHDRLRGSGRRPVDDGIARRVRPASPSAW